MSIARRRSGSAWIDLTHARRRSGSAWIDVAFGRRRSGSAWIDVWPVGELRVVTVGVATDVKGFQAGFMGSIDNSSLNGQTITQVDQEFDSMSGITTFFVRITGTLAKSWLTSVTLNGTTYATASSGHSQSGGNTLWTWVAGPFDSNSSGNTVNVIFAI